MKIDHHSTNTNNEECAVFDIKSFDLVAFLPYQIRLYYKSVSDLLSHTYIGKHDLTVREWRAIVLLNKFEPTTASVIIDNSSMDKVSVSRAIASLEKRGIIERYKDNFDRRRSLINLTAKGNGILEELIPQIKTIETKILEGINEEDISKLKSIMAKVQANAEKLL